MWRAEAQKNDNIHFHIIADKYIHWRDLRDSWNRILKDYKYVSKYVSKQDAAYRIENGLPNAISCQGQGRSADSPVPIDQYKAWEDPNSTDIHKLDKVDNVSNYVCKYLTKNQGYRKIEGRIHGSSDTIRNTNYFWLEKDVMCEELIMSLNQSNRVQATHGEYYDFYKCDTKGFLARANVDVLRAYVEYYMDLFNVLYFDGYRNRKDKEFEEVVRQCILRGTGDIQLNLFDTEDIVYEGLTNEIRNSWVS